MNGYDFKKIEEKLLELEAFFRDKDEYYEYYKKIVNNLVIHLYLENDRTDRIRDFGKIVKKEEYYRSIAPFIPYVETKSIGKKIKKDISDLEEKIEKERIRSVEILGIFGVIIAFIISSVQVSSNVLHFELELLSALFIIISIALVLLGFIVAIHKIVIEKGIGLLHILLIILLIAVLVIQIYLNL